MTTAITLTESRQHEHIEILANGIIITGEPSDVEIANVFQKLADYGDAKVWGVGDMMLWFQQQPKHRATYEQFISLTRYSFGGCLNARRLCDRFPQSKRMFPVAPDYYRRVITLPDEDAFALLRQVHHAEGEDMREFVRSEVKRIKNQPDPRKATLTLSVSADGEVTADEKPPTWAWNNVFEITIKEKVA